MVIENIFFLYSCFSLSKMERKRRFRFGKDVNISDFLSSLYLTHHINTVSFYSSNFIFYLKSPMKSHTGSK